MKNLAIAVGLLASCTAAPAQQIFDYTFSGPAFYRSADSPFATFSGTVEAILASGGDGIYAGDNLISVDVKSTFGSYHIDGGLLHNKPGTASTLDVAGGTIDSFAARFLTTWFDPVWGPEDPCATLDITGLSIHYLNYLTNTFYANADLIPVAAVPEPETYALMISGLVLLLSRRKTKA